MVSFSVYFQIFGEKMLRQICYAALVRIVTTSLPRAAYFFAKNYNRKHGNFYFIFYRGSDANLVQGVCHLRQILRLYFSESRHTETLHRHTTLIYLKQTLISTSILFADNTRLLTMRFECFAKFFRVGFFGRNNFFQKCKTRGCKFFSWRENLEARWNSERS